MKMTVTVVLFGMPTSVTLTDIAYNLDKLFDTNEIGTFKVRKLVITKSRKMKWQIALDFRSGFDAIIAQEILDGYNYTIPNGTEYKICAKVTNDSELMTKEPSSSITSSSSSNSYDASSFAQTLMSKKADEEVNKAHAKLDLGTDSEEVIWRRRRRSRFAPIPDTNSSSSGNTRSTSRESGRSKYRHGMRCRNMKSSHSRSPFRSNSRENKNSRPLAIKHKPSPSKRTHGEICSETGRCSTPEKYRQYIRGKERYKNDCYSSICHDRHKTYNTSPSRRSDTKYYRREHNNYRETIKNYDYKKRKADRNRYSDDEILKKKRYEAAENVMAAMQSQLELIIHNNYTNILWKDVNMILKQVKGIVASRIEQIKIRSDISVNKIITYYRYQYSKADDVMLLEKLVKELSSLYPQNCADHVQSKPERTEKRNSIERMSPFDEQDSKIWRQMDEVLHDIKMETKSDVDKQDTKGNVTKPLDSTNAVITEIVDVTSEPLIDKDKNKQFEIIVVIKKNNKRPTDQTVQIANEVSSTDTPVVDLIESEQNAKTIPSNPVFYLTIKNILKRMRPNINAVVKHIDVDKFNLIIEEELRIKIRKLLEGKCYMRHDDITKLFRAHNPVEDDEFFVKKIVEGMNNGNYDNFVSSSSMEKSDEQSSNDVETTNDTTNKDNVNLGNCETTVKDDNPSTNTKMNNKNHNQNEGFETVVKSKPKPLGGTMVKEENLKEPNIIFEKSDVTPKIHRTTITSDEHKIEKIEKCHVAGNKADKFVGADVIIANNTALDTEVVIVETGSDMNVIMLSDSEDEGTDSRMKRNQPLAKVFPGQTLTNFTPDNGKNKRKSEQQLRNDMKQRKVQRLDNVNKCVAKGFKKKSSHH